MRNFMIKAMSLAATFMIFAVPVMAQDAAGTYKGKNGSVVGALAVAVAAFAAALGDGKAVAAACEGTARNPGAGPRIFTMMILGLALIETLVLVTFGAAFLGL